MIDFLVFDTFTIVFSAVILIIAVLACFFTPYVRYRREDGEDAVVSEVPSLSVILTPHDEADKLEVCLPLLLKQNYPAGFQVIVVIEEGEHETEDLVKRIQGELSDKPGDGSLYMTYIPDSSRYMSRKKLAMTLGVKAAKTEWVLFTEPYSRPSSDEWLLTMAQRCSEGTDMVIGYGNYEETTPAFKRFERLNMAYYLMREDTKGIAYTTLSHNILLRKSLFMEQEGFRGNLELIRGEYDFLVNKYATETGTVLVTNHEAWMTDDEPSRKTWLNKHIFYAETRKTLSRSGRHRVWFNVDQIALHASLLLIVSGIVFGALAMNLVVLAAAAIALIASWVVRSCMGFKAMKRFEEYIPFLAIYPFQLSLVWHNLNYLIRHRFADKLDFTTHKQ